MACETLPASEKAALINLSEPHGVRTDIEFHIQAISELINVLLNQVKILQSESQYGEAMPSLALRDEVRRFEMQLIQRALTRTEGCQVQAAELLRVNASTLNSKIKRYRIKTLQVNQSQRMVLSSVRSET